MFLDTIELKTFLFFHENTDEHGFTVESTTWRTGSSASSGFYLTSIPIAIERGWISYEEGYQCANTTLNSYYDNPHDPDDFYVENEHGFFPHWFDQDTGNWNGVDCFSSIDTAIFMAGVLTVNRYFAGTEIETVATKLYEDVDWEWMRGGDDTLSMGWRPDTGFLPHRWQGYNEGMLAVLLALGSSTHPIPDDSWDAWARTYRQAEYTYGNQSYTFVESTSTSLFTYQYPQIWFDLRDKTDRVGVNHFQNSVNATLENRAYCIENPNNHTGYGSNVWGLTACECPLHEYGYGAHGPRQCDDGTIAPTGAGGSMIFTPDESIAALRYMNETYGDGLWGEYGFRDAFNPGMESGIGWFAPTYIGIDQGAILTMIENHRSGLVWNLFMQNDCAKKAILKAGFVDRGDINQDGAITPADVVLTLKLAVTGKYDPIGDMNDDRRISSLDALMTLQAAAGQVCEVPKTSPRSCAPFCPLPLTLAIVAPVSQESFITITPPPSPPAAIHQHHQTPLPSSSDRLLPATASEPKNRHTKQSHTSTHRSDQP